LSSELVGDSEETCEVLLLLFAVAAAVVGFVAGVEMGVERKLVEI